MRELIALHLTISAAACRHADGICRSQPGRKRQFATLHCVLHTGNFTAAVFSGMGDRSAPRCLRSWNDMSYVKKLALLGTCITKSPSADKLPCTTEGILNGESMVQRTAHILQAAQGLRWMLIVGHQPEGRTGHFPGCNAADGLRLGNGREQKGGIEARAIARPTLADGGCDISALGWLLQMQPVGSEPAHMAA